MLLVGVVEEVLAEFTSRVVRVMGGGRGHACDAAEDRGGFQRRGDVVPFAVDLDHEDRDFEGGVDLGVGHKIPPDDAVFDVRLWRFVDGWCFGIVVIGGCRGGGGGGSVVIVVVVGAPFAGG